MKKRQTEKRWKDLERDADNLLSKPCQPSKVTPRAKTKTAETALNISDLVKNRLHKFQDAVPSTRPF